MRITSRSDIECPGDVIPFNCLVESNSETIHLTWRVVLPTGTILNITYNNTSLINDLYPLNSFISSSLTGFMKDKYAESSLNITVVADVLINQTKIECLINQLDNDTVYVPVNRSGMTVLSQNGMYSDHRQFAIGMWRVFFLIHLR